MKVDAVISSSGNSSYIWSKVARFFLEAIRAGFFAGIWLKLKSDEIQSSLRLQKSTQNPRDIQFFDFFAIKLWKIRNFSIKIKV